MAIPQGTTVFQWLAQQIYNQSRLNGRIKTVVEDWSLYTPAQKNVFRARAVDGLNEAIAELQIIRDNIAGI